MSGSDSGRIIHASCVALGGRGVLILGPSGSGKSSLALQLMAIGAVLVSDDRTELALREGVLIARAPAAIAGLIEARGLGLLRADIVGPVAVGLAVDLARSEDRRLPPRDEWSFMGAEVALISGQEGAHFPAAIRQYMLGGRSD